ncbi:hypothetical protein EVAR_15133_1 [Eumeta japonica]|uniref:Uncharacterized protein n=1 Tax=Eumeta variegata TaxID=151549 RepID=A0A4C1UIG4_EUMVA|nr:hypothetical protein EVAR_15133_1 [Eumeta japonica]
MTADRAPPYASGAGSGKWGEFDFLITREPELGNGCICLTLCEALFSRRVSISEVRRSLGAAVTDLPLSAFALDASSGAGVLSQLSTEQTD